MPETTASPAELIATNPATGLELGRVPKTEPQRVSEIVERAREAQKIWAEVPIRERLKRIDAWRKSLAREAESWGEVVSNEIGKPRSESLGELVSTLDSVRWTVKHARRVLADRRIGAGRQRLMLLTSSTLSWRPLGVVGMIGTWNYPILLNALPIAEALAAGNGVVWKPSELATLTGLKLQESLAAADLPPGLVSAVFGYGDVGQALLESRIDKGLFTGGVPNGRRVLAELGARGVPAVAELSGFDAAIVLPDADPAKVSRPLAWASFVGAGQTCVAVKRIYAVGDARPLAEAIAGVARSLRVGDPGSEIVDVGPLISEPARDRFDQYIRAAIEAGAEVLAGATRIERTGTFYAPTVLLAPDRRAEQALAGCFGPVVVIRSVRSADEAVSETNASEFGLGSSVWSQNVRSAREVAARIDAGMVWINDAVTPSAHAASPFGGVRSSGFGRTKGEEGLREFATPRTLQVQSLSVPRPQIYPYAEKTARLIGLYIKFMHRS